MLVVGDVCTFVSSVGWLVACVSGSKDGRLSEIACSEFKKFGVRVRVRVA